MSAESKEVLSLFATLENLEASKKEIADEMKSVVEAFASSHEMNKKSVNKAFKEWKQWKKDQAEYTEVDYEADALLVKAVPEMAPEGN